MTTAPPATVADALDALDWEPVRCHRCGKVIGDSAIGSGHARFRCRWCKAKTLWPWPTRGRTAAPEVEGEIRVPRCGPGIVTKG